MPTAKLVVSILAEQDLRQIGRHTAAEWGRRQRTRYLTVLDNAFRELAVSPELGRDESSVKPGYRSFPEGRHLIFYRAISGGIEVVRIFHQAMDYRSRF